MANILNGMISDNIAREGFSAFTDALMPLGVFTTDFSGDILRQGNTVLTRIIPVAADAVDLQSDAGGDREDAQVIKDLATSAVTVTLNQEPILGFAFTDQEVDSIEAGVFTDTIVRNIRQTAYSVAKAVLDFTQNLITNANFGAPLATIAPTVWDFDDVVDLATTMKTDHKWDFTAGDTALVMQPGYTGNIQKDLKDNSASTLNVVRGGSSELIGKRLGDFNYLESQTLPPVGGTPAAENLGGFAARPSAIAIAMRATRSQDVADLIDYRVMVDDVTGATLVFRVWHGRGKGKVFYTFETKFGASVGQSEALKRIQTA